MMLEDTDYIFMTITGETDYDPGPVRYLSLPNECFFEKDDIFVECPEILILVEALRDITGLLVYLDFYLEDVSSRSEEVIMTTFVEEDGDEILNSLVTPLGMFLFIFFDKDENGNLFEVSPVRLTDEIMEVLYLRSCKIVKDEDYYLVKFVSGCPKVKLPLLHPDQYLFDTDEWRVAVEYWKVFGEDEMEEETDECDDDFITREELRELLEDGPVELEFINLKDDTTKNIFIEDEEDIDELFSDEGEEPEFRDYVIRI